MDNDAQKDIAGVSAIASGAIVGTAGPTVAMSVATTAGVASTGTSIATLTGIAQTNAALAWLGGGTLATGGAGIAGGSALLAAIPVVGGVIALFGIGYLIYHRTQS